MSTIAVYDSEGYAIPWTADDETIECGFDDPSWGDPESWPAWTDAGIWETGPEIDVTVEPYEPSEDDLASYREWCMEVDRRWADERIESGPITDQDVALVTGCAG